IAALLWIHYIVKQVLPIGRPVHGKSRPRTWRWQQLLATLWSAQELQVKVHHAVQTVRTEHDAACIGRPKREDVVTRVKRLAIPAVMSRFIRPDIHIAVYIPV